MFQIQVAGKTGLPGPDNPSQSTTTHSGRAASPAAGVENLLFDMEFSLVFLFKCCALFFLTFSQENIDKKKKYLMEQSAPRITAVFMMCE